MVASGPGFAFIPLQLASFGLAPFPDKSFSRGGKGTTGGVRAPILRKEYSPLCQHFLQMSPLPVWPGMILMFSSVIAGAITH